MPVLFDFLHSVFVQSAKLNFGAMLMLSYLRLKSEAMPVLCDFLRSVFVQSVKLNFKANDAELALLEK